VLSCVGTSLAGRIDCILAMTVPLLNVFSEHAVLPQGCAMPQAFTYVLAGDAAL
jgi:hypothetical protein